MELHDMVGMDKALETGPKAKSTSGNPAWVSTDQSGRQTYCRNVGKLSRPGISQFWSFPLGGGFISYGPDLANMYRRIGFMFSRFSVALDHPICRSNVLPSSIW